MFTEHALILALHVIFFFTLGPKKTAPVSFSTARQKAAFSLSAVL
jgi:hypothetical protein